MLRFYSLCLSLSILCSCAGIQYSDRITPTYLNRDIPEVTARVLAKAEEWRNSGANVEKGNKYSIKANGRWKAGGLCGWTSPDGVGCYALLCWDLGGQPVPGYSASTLIGRISEQGHPFSVGNELELCATENGILYFRINDVPGWCGDNEGYVDVKVSLIHKIASSSDVNKKTVLNPKEQARKLYEEGNAYFKAQSYKEAEESYKKAIDLETGFAPIYYNIAMTQIELGKKADAVANLRRYLELRPDAPNASEVTELTAIPAGAGRKVVFEVDGST